jgi:hypothetical protein
MVDTLLPLKDVLAPSFTGVEGMAKLIPDYENTL